MRKPWPAEWLIVSPAQYEAWRIGETWDKEGESSLLRENTPEPGTRTLFPQCSCDFMTGEGVSHLEK